MRNIEKVLVKNNKKEILDELFNQAYTVSLVKYESFEGRSSIRKEGHYISLEKLSDKQLSRTHVVFRMFYTIEKLVKKKFIGEVTQLDTENNLQEGRTYLLEVLNKYINGDFNDKIEEALVINDINDFKRIVKDNDLNRRMCNFIIKATENKLKNHIRRNNNVDSYFDSNSNTFKNIDFIYLDSVVEGADGETRLHELIADENAVIDKENKMNLYKYIFKNYINSSLLTKSQLDFFYEVSDNAIIDGKVIVSERYDRKLVYKYKNTILKRLEKVLQNDENIGKILDEKGNVRKYFLK